MADESSERDHEASGKRLSELRQKGTVLRSKDLSSGVIYLTAVILLIFISENLANQVENNFHYIFDNISNVMTNSSFPNNVLHYIIVNNVRLTLPLILTLFIVAFLPPFIYGGWNFTLEIFAFKLDNLDIFTNIPKLFSAHSFVDVAKSFVKLTMIIGALTIFVLSDHNEIASLSQEPLKIAINHSFNIIKHFIITMTVSLIFVVAFDVLLSYFKFKKQHKMTSQEVKDEYKQMEGNIDVKRKIRISQFKFLRQRLKQVIPKANVIITNPTHYAVALRYEDKKDRAPKVVAKGKDLMAQQIRMLAIMNAVPIYQAPVLSRALYHTTKIGSEIHPELYMAVAIVLSYIQQLRNYQHGLARMPEAVADLKIPKEFVYDE